MYYNVGVVVFLDVLIFFFPPSFGTKKPDGMLLVVGNNIDGGIM